MTDSVDLSDEIIGICSKIDLNPRYVAEIEITPKDLTVTTYHGRQGRGRGPVAIDHNGPRPEPVKTIETYPITMTLGPLESKP